MASRPPTALLVHANPFQRVTPVPPYGLERIRTAAEPTGAELVSTIRRLDVPADMGLIFGLPGETEETIAETVAFVRALPCDVAYRAVRVLNGRSDWQAVLDAVAQPGDPSKTPGEALASVAQLAAWHGRFDLAARAFRRLLRQRQLPERLTRSKVLFAGIGAGAIALADRRRLQQEVSGVQ